MTRWIAPALALACLMMFPVSAEAKTCHRLDRSRGVMVKVACPVNGVTARKAAAHQRHGFRQQHHRRGARRVSRHQRLGAPAHVPEYEGRGSLAVSDERVAHAAVDVPRRPARHRTARAARGAERLARTQRPADYGGTDRVVDEARRWLGTNPTHRRTLWCAAFMNLVLKNVGLRGTGSDLARSFASAGQRVPGPRVGAIAVMARRGGGHVGVVSGIDRHGNPIIISGNHRRTVAEAVYPRGRVYAYVIPR
jgi:uncharacterized protein (TIGR02594 family)